MAERPGRPASDRPDDLNFRPVKRMVPWLSPRQLSGTALRMVLSGMFGSYSDKREIQASLPAAGPFSYADRPELWFDFVADLGDAFGPTYTVASLLAREHLDLAGPGGRSWATEQGQVLVMGGDQVYPVASARAYENQAVGPYRAALPYRDGDPLDLYVIPGNHDWYDGLTAFMRVFCRQQWVGGWKTRQSRSYFAVELPNRWWLWGADVQFDSYIDEPQFRYFEEMAKALGKGDSVILCWAMPSWVRANRRDHPEAYATLDYFERKLIRPREAVVRLTLTGDLHHYARYVDTADGSQKITAGGGGAFLSETHNLPPELVLPPPGSRDPGKTSPPSRYRMVAAFPDRGTSRRLRWRAAALPFMNGSFWALMGGAYLAFAWMAQASARATRGGSFSEVMTDLSYLDIVRSLVRSPLAVLLALVLAVGLAGFTKSKEPVRKWGLGLAHASAHLVLIVVVIGMSASVARVAAGSGAWFLVAFLVAVGGGGGLIGSWVMAAYLVVADRFFSLNENELFAAQRNGDYKCFLRLHIGEDGELTVYPIGIERTPRRWTLKSGGVGNEPWFEPGDGAVAPRLIEEPIRMGAAPPASP